MGHGEWRNGAWLAEVERQVKCVRCTTLREKSCSRPRTAAPRLRTPQCAMYCSYSASPHCLAARHRGYAAAWLRSWAPHPCDGPQTGGCLVLRIGIAHCHSLAPTPRNRGCETNKRPMSHCLCPLPSALPLPRTALRAPPYPIPHTHTPYPIPISQLWHCGTVAHGHSRPTSWAEGPWPIAIAARRRKAKATCDTRRSRITQQRKLLQSCLGFQCQLPRVHLVHVPCPVCLGRDLDTFNEPAQDSETAFLIWHLQRFLTFERAAVAIARRTPTFMPSLRVHFCKHERRGL